MIKPSEVSDILKRQLEEVDSRINFEEVGTVLSVGDGVAHVFGLDNVHASELVEFENGERVKLRNLHADKVIIAIGDEGIIDYKGQTIQSFQRK